MRASDYKKTLGYGHGAHPRTPNHHRTGILSEDYPMDPYNKDLDKAFDPYDRYWRTGNPASLYSVAVDGRPVYSSHLRDQAMQRFMHQRASGRGEVTLSIDGDVAYRAGSGGGIRVGNPEYGTRRGPHGYKY